MIRSFDTAACPQSISVSQLPAAWECVLKKIRHYNLTSQTASCKPPIHGRIERVSRIVSHQDNACVYMIEKQTNVTHLNICFALSRCFARPTETKKPYLAPVVSRLKSAQIACL